MMTNLFSVFDPSSSIFNLSLNWMSTFLGLLLIPSAYWLMPSRWHIFWNSILLTLHKEFKTLLGPSGHSGSTFIFVSLFSLILFNNFMGLFPYIFTSTSHLTLTLTLALPLWLCFMLYGWINHTQHMFAHLVPQGTPAVLMPFMVCIETISNIIRPGTLAVRLAANMIAGHLLLTLLGNTGPSLSYAIVSLLLIGQIALLVLESAVAIIQSYVFAVLSTLYSSEVN
ncbi:ATP synthase F0 subunit 6 (mitochondrion) [Bactrocera neohumeralis]|uniref:ATP synthase subunit a n=4 Tax=Dacini TaxID=43871 RepID=A0A0U2D5X6_ZEUTA|nr:ATP synthase F0 subunit 6 [Bactrocera tryoni]YP_006883645.1 ATP synthase F0 subunit 6 [Bactrocera correcta]YP_009145576.1 ATP synthase F0 subunit 6 [Zeugodacus tau]YP_009162822.1 ATP synthase F0 subunit 6 [Bactrocera zonata]YP_010328110.1 ATP synthase F0 subunit 6 [Bactrocera frauenfeldi]YP_010328123.1 ATP synthase F0 subunit 6 [Bactrocera neohumeralis]YP_010693260.1 ATP synthase F0 subunit 6 [Bactrocera nigrotibialis]YP_010693286.1 ATP synthase F0 subunit 6 [Bactrocera tuberculata]ADM94